MIVLDASLTLAWYYSNERSETALGVMDRVIAEGATTTALWPIEVANSLQMSVRRGKIDATARDQYIGHLLGLEIEIDGGTAANVWTSAIQLSNEHGLTVYDATYLELALRLGLSLATLDDELIAAARAEGVEVLP